MGQSSKPQTIGHRYFLGIHWGLAKALNGIREIRVGDRRAWVGDAQGQARWLISASSLFGGDQGEGGIYGTIDLMQGWENQPVNPRLKRMLGSALVPAHRGCATAFYDGLVCSMNPYPKAWMFRVWRTTADWDDDIVFYPSRVVIPLGNGSIAAVNGAHIIYEAITNRDWGRGRSRNRIHEASFRAVADTLYAESFGLCICWRRQDGVASLVQSVLDHIGGVLIDDLATGQISLKLIRNDYDVASLPLFDEDNGLLAIEADEAADGAGAVNEIVVKFKNMLNGGAEDYVRIQNLAGIQSVGAVLSETVDYPHIPTPTLAARVAQRDLASKSAGVRRFKVRTDRRGASVMPGDVIRVRSLVRGYEQLVLRVGRADYGTLQAGACTFNCVIDSYGLPATSYVSVGESSVNPPSTQPLSATIRRILELPYRDLAANLPPERLSAVTPTSGALALLARRPSHGALGYYLLTRVGAAAFGAVDEGDWCPTAQIAIDLAHLTVNARITYQTDCTSVRVGSVGLIDDEIVRVDAFDIDSGEIQLGRGCSDTVPTPHLKGARIWFYGLDAAVDPTDYTSGVTVQAKAQTRTTSGLLDAGLAPTDSLTLSGRQYRPYPPGRFRINGEAYPAEVEGNIAVSWAHRDRLTQADQLVDTTAGNMGPEAGATYTCRLLRADTNAVLLSQSGINGTAHTFVPDYGTYAGEVKVELWSVRDGVASAQKHEWQFEAGPIEGMQELSVVNTSIQPPAGVTSSISRLIQSSTAIGDLMLAFVMHAGPLTTVPAGWSLVISATGANDRLSVYKKIAEAGDPGNSRTWVMSVSSRFSVHYVVLRGTEPLDVVAFNSEVSAAGVSNNPTPIAAVAATAVGQVVLNTACQLANTSVPSSFTVSAPWTLRTNASSATQANRHGVADLTVGDLDPVEGEWTPSPANASSSWASISVVVGYAGT